MGKYPPTLMSPITQCYEVVRFLFETFPQFVFQLHIAYWAKGSAPLYVSACVSGICAAKTLCEGLSGIGCFQGTHTMVPAEERHEQKSADEMERMQGLAGE